MLSVTSVLMGRKSFSRRINKFEMDLTCAEVSLTTKRSTPAQNLRAAVYICSRTVYGQRWSYYSFGAGGGYEGRQAIRA